MRLTITIQLGNDAMRAPEDIARALAQLGRDIVDNDDERLLERAGRVATVRDDNGNRVGEARLSRTRGA